MIAYSGDGDGGVGDGEHHPGEGLDQGGAGHRCHRLRHGHGAP